MFASLQSEAHNFNLQDTIEPNMEYNGQIVWHVRRGADEPNMQAYLTNVFDIGRKQCPIRFSSYPAHSPFF